MSPTSATLITRSSSVGSLTYNGKLYDVKVSSIIFEDSRSSKGIIGYHRTSPRCPGQLFHHGYIKCCGIINLQHLRATDEMAKAVSPGNLVALLNKFLVLDHTHCKLTRDVWLCNKLISNKTFIITVALGNSASCVCMLIMTFASTRNLLLSLLILTFVGD